MATSSSSILNIGDNLSSSMGVPFKAQSLSFTHVQADPLQKEPFIRLNTHDTSFVDSHISGIEKFAEDLQGAVNAVWPSRNKKTRYSEVHAVLISWEDDNLSVEREINRLHQVFSSIYRFEVQEFRIPRKLPGLATISHLSSFLLNTGQDCLLIVYYAGHTRLSLQTNEPPIWTATDKPDSPNLPSGGVQQLVEESELNVLMLYDCCHSSHPAVGVSGQGVTEVIAACGFETQAPIVGPHSFTNALIRVLEESFMTAPFSVADLHGRIIGNLKNWKPALLRDNNGNVWRDEKGRPKWECHKRRTPVHCFLTNEMPCRTIMLAPLSPAPAAVPAAYVNPSTTDVNNTTDTDSKGGSAATDSTTTLEVEKETEKTKTLQVLLAVRLEEDFLSGDDDVNTKVRSWCEWMRNIPPAANSVKIEGIYRSCSTLVLLSMPVVFWDLLPDNVAYSFIGFVASDNLALDALHGIKTRMAFPTTQSIQRISETTEIVRSFQLAEGTQQNTERGERDFKRLETKHTAGTETPKSVLSAMNKLGNATQIGTSQGHQNILEFSQPSAYIPIRILPEDHQPGGSSSRTVRSGLGTGGRRRCPSLRGWWHCCQCGADVNPQIFSWTCSVCYHGKCDYDCYIHQQRKAIMSS